MIGLVAGPRIDLNSDVGESFGSWNLGQDEALIPLVSSINVACGFHAGDPLVMERTVGVAQRSGVAIGAHPGYPDLVGFGRRDLDMAPDELEAALLYQVGALAAFASAAGTELQHVKPHGALYNRASVDREVARTIARAARRFSGGLILVGLGGSALLDAGREAGLRVAAEAFADRAYEPDGTLRSRRQPEAVLTDPDRVAQRAVAIATESRVEAIDGSIVEMHAETICVHGDTPGAAVLAQAVRAALDAAGVTVQPLGRM
jgi:5-oxoprolinase (ATP-hydrolysing) subunit A